MGKPLINPIYYNEAVKKTWKEHNCDAEAGICDCPFLLICPSCGIEQHLLGEGLDQHFGRDCKCEACFYGVDDAATFSCSNCTPDCMRCWNAAVAIE
jgi:hypothetical protein